MAEALTLLALTADLPDARLDSLARELARFVANVFKVRKSNVRCGGQQRA